MKRELPLGLKWIKVLVIIFLAILLLGLPAALFLQSDNPWSTVPILRMILAIVTPVLLLISIYKPGRMQYKLAIAFLALVAVFIIQRVIEHISDIPLFVPIFLMDLLFLWYIIKIEDYFIEGEIDTEDEYIQEIDKRFNIIAIILLVLMVLLPSAYLIIKYLLL